MEYLSSSSYEPLCPQNNEIYQTPNCVHHPAQQPQSDGDLIAPTPHQDHSDDHNSLDHILAQISHFIEEDHHHDDHQVNKPINHNGQRRKASSTVHDHAPPHENNEKKKQRIIHREVERRRRLEMSSLHASLRSLLPIDFIKGKRSMSDHLDVTVKYIQHLQQKIQVLNEKRDALKVEECNYSSSNNYEVSVNPWNNGGVDVIVSTSSSDIGGNKQEFPLSRILQCLAKQGLDVVSCISNRVSDKFVHSIQAQVGDGRSITAVDPVELQQKLASI